MKSLWYQRFSIGGVTLVTASIVLLAYRDFAGGPGVLLAGILFLGIAAIIGRPHA